MSRRGFAHTEEDLARYREVQQLAYACVTAVERELEAGMTERDAAASMRRWLTSRGVTRWFHTPFAWFAERTAFEGRLWTSLSFFPTRRRLAPGMPVILDVAPVVDGYAADVGYACAFGDNRLHARMMRDLEPFRTLILEGVRAGRTLRQIYRDVDELIVRQGYRNRHSAYPYGVLAHRVDRMPSTRLDSFVVGGFGLSVLRHLGRQAASARRGRARSPFWNDHPTSDHPATPGLWAVEPHIGFRGVGVKWEELLVVTDEDAYWLDDDLPHVRGWSHRDAGSARVSA